MTKDYDYAWAVGWEAYLAGYGPDFPGGPKASSDVYLGWHAGYRDAKMLHEAIGYSPKLSHAKMHTCHAKIAVDRAAEMR